MDTKKTVTVEGPAAQTARRAGKTLQNAAAVEATHAAHYPIESQRQKTASAYYARRKVTRRRIAELCKRSVAR